MITFTNGSFIYTKEDMATMETLRMSRYFLVVNGGVDEPAKCKRCQTIHPYLTRMCIEQPYRGLRSALWAYARVTANTDHKRRVHALRNVPYLHTQHPYTAHGEAPRITGGEGEDVVAYELGAAEPIDEKRALRYAEALKVRRVQPPYILDG